MMKTTLLNMSRASDETRIADAEKRSLSDFSNLKRIAVLRDYGRDYAGYRVFRPGLFAEAKAAPPNLSSHVEEGPSGVLNVFADLSAGRSND